MTLLLAEGFEHIHPSAISIPGFGCKVAAFRGDYGYYDPSGLPTYYNWDNISVVAGYGDGQVANARKGGKALMFSLPGDRPHILLNFKKSRIVYVGFAFRIPIETDSWDGEAFRISFERYKSRGPIQDSEIYVSEQFETFGTCIWKERTGYADLEWTFGEQEPIYEQIIHNQDVIDGDWHYIEFATTVYGGTVGNPQGWCETRFSNTTNRRENILTAASGSDEAFFINAIKIISGTLESIVFDDIYVTNDEGEVNNSFLGSIYIRPMSPSFTGNLKESTTVNTIFRHDAVGPEYIGDESELPNPLPTPEEEPNFTEWGDPTGSYMLLPLEGAKQTFRCTDASFMDSNPRIHGVVLDVIAEMPDKKSAKASLTPIKTIENTNHTYYPISCDMIPHTLPALHQLIMENPKANDPVVEQYDNQWSTIAVNNSEYGFKIDKVIEQVPYNSDWNPALLRYPLVYDKTVDDVMGLEDWPLRYWEEIMYEVLTFDPYSRWDWACPVYENLDMFDTPQRIRASFCFAWSNAKMDAVILMPEEFMKDSLGFEEYIRADAVTLIEETIGVTDSAYHEWVEELQSWFNSYDFINYSWGATAEDNISLAISDIFDNHFFIGDTVDIIDQTRSNHEFIGETLYSNDIASQGIGVFAEDGFNVEANHHDGNWVEQIENWIGYESSILTRHWRFEYFYGVCIRWWNIGVVEQPLEIWETDPCTVSNDEWAEDYAQFVAGEGGIYDAVMQDVKDQWLLAGGDPSLNFDNVRWTHFNSFVYDGFGNAIDMLDADGNTIIQEPV